MDPGGGMTCINNDSSCLTRVTPDPRGPGREDPSFAIINKLIRCLDEEIEGILKIQTELQNEMLMFPLSVGGTSASLKGVEGGLDYLGLETAAELVPYVDYAALAWHLVEGVTNAVTAWQRLSEVEQRACRCERYALIN